ncbi:MAG TPA: CoA transferase, partial [Acidimicrobiales bacterium]|nr:CoA transferase [Acidimicrobiales bacterium]
PARAAPARPAPPAWPPGWPAVRGGTGGGPLAGVKVLDLSVNMTGPTATLILAQQGADVLKLEPPGGDVVRRIGSGRDGTSAYFANLNRGKRSIVVDVQQAAGRDLALRLSDAADVVVQNFRPGVVERLGLGPDELCARNPSLVYVSINGFGTTGPMAALPAYDHVVQALSGIAALQSDPRSGTGALVRQGIVDKVTGYTVAQAVTAALFARATSGRGTRIEVPMLDAALSFTWPDGMMNQTCLDPVTVVPPIANTFRPTQTADGYIVLIAVTDEQWQGLFRASGLTHLLDDPDFATPGLRLKNGGRAMRQIGAIFGALPTTEVLERLSANDVACAPLVALEDVAHQPQVVAAGSLEESVDPVLGRVVQPRPAARFVDIGAPIARPAPPLGADTADVLADMGLSDDEVALLRASGAVG